MAVLNTIQEGALSAWTGNNTTITISAVDLTRSILLVDYRVNTGDPQYGFIFAVLENSTTIRIRRYSAGASVNLKWQVVSFTSGVTVQRGTNNMGVNPQNVTISAVTLSNSFPIVTWLSQGTAFSQEDAIAAYISNTTTLELRADSAGATVEVAWQVVTYDTATVQVKYDEVLNSGTKDLTITTVNRNKTFLIGSWRTSVAATTAAHFPIWLFTSDTTIRLFRYNTNVVDTIRITLYIVSIPDNIFVQQAAIPFSAGTTIVVQTVTAFNPATTMLIGGAIFKAFGSANVADDLIGEASFTFVRQSPTQIRIQREASTYDAWVLFTAVDFSGGSAATQFLKAIARGISNAIQNGIE